MVFDLYEELPWQKVAELKGQSTRAAISIASNIAEGNSRRSEKDKHRFMEIALGLCLRTGNTNADPSKAQNVVPAKRAWSELLAAIDEQQKNARWLHGKLKHLMTTRCGSKLTVAVAQRSLRPATSKHSRTLAHIMSNQRRPPQDPHRPCQGVWLRVPQQRDLRRPERHVRLRPLRRRAEEQHPRSTGGRP